MIFKAVESLDFAGYYRIETNLFALPEDCQFCADSNYHWRKLQASLMGLSLPSYLRYLRDCHEGTLVGKQKGHLRVYFKNKKNCDNIITELNERWIKYDKQRQSKNNS